MSEKNIAYLCSGEDPDCKKSICEYLGLGPCSHRLDEQYRLVTDKETLFVEVYGGKIIEIFADELDYYKEEWNAKEVEL